jgi:hypothetical protein
VVDLKEQESKAAKNKSKKNDYKDNYNRDEKLEVEKKVKKEVPVITFDSFFQYLLRSQPSKVFVHHKAAMLAYAKQNGLLTGTKKQFEDLFKSY